MNISYYFATRVHCYLGTCYFKHLEGCNHIRLFAVLGG